MADGDERDLYPPEVMKYCPRCGSGRFSFREHKSFLCRDCGFEYYINAAAAVAALIEDTNGRLLLVRRAREPRKGALDLPGGFVDPGETAELALGREIREELGLDLATASYFCSSPNTYLYNGIVYYTLDLAFVCTVHDLGRIETGDDAGEHLFLPPADIRPEDIGFDSVREITRRYTALKAPKG